MNGVFLTASMASLRSVAPALEAKGYDSGAFQALMTAYLHDMNGVGLGIPGVSPSGERGDGRVDVASSYVPSPAPVANLTTANEFSRG